MPVDPSMPERTAHHRDGVMSYPCHTWPKPPGADWALDHGRYCRNSLDMLSGADDPRCPMDCPHKAPRVIAETFEKRSRWLGAKNAAEWVREQSHDGV